MFSIKNVSSGYKESIILQNVNIEIGKGEVVALMGKNGVGKTTLLKTIMGIIKLRTGEILFNSEDISNWPPEKRALHGIGYVPQGREIFPFLTVKENLLLGLEARNKNAKNIPEDIYKIFPELKTISERKGGNLSGGQQQQLAIARVLITEPQLLLLDEPTEGIQPSIVFEIENTIRMIKDQGTISILLVEQFMDFALRLADVCYIMEKGQISFQERVSKLSRDEVKNHLTL